MGAHSKPGRTQRRKLRLLFAGAAVAGIVGGTAITTGALPINPGPLTLDGHRFNDGEVVHSPADDGLELEVVPDDDAGFLDVEDGGMDWIAPLDVDGIEVWVDEDGAPLGWNYPGSDASRLGPPDPDDLVLPGSWPVNEDWDEGSSAPPWAPRQMTLDDYFTFNWNGHGSVG